MTSLTVLLFTFSAVLFAVLSAMMAVSIQTKDICQLDTKTKEQLNKLFPMLLTFGVDVLKTKQAIIVSVLNKYLKI